MNDADLDKRLKAARDPGLPPAYQSAFTDSVLSRLEEQPASQPSAAEWMPRFAWGFSFAASFLAGVLALAWWQNSSSSSSAPDLLANAKLIQQTLALFPNQVEAIIQDKQGLKLVLSDQPDVPASTPLYVHVCDGQNCSSLVTFSGQNVSLGGRQLTVLAEANGGIIVTGERFAWSSDKPTAVTHDFSIEARSLSLRTM